MGPTKLRYERTGPAGEPVDKDLPESVRGIDFMENAPDTLEAFGLAKGSPAEAQTVLNAMGVGRLVQNTGAYSFGTDVLVILGKDWKPSS